MRQSEDVTNRSPSDQTSYAILFLMLGIVAINGILAIVNQYVTRMGVQNTIAAELFFVSIALIFVLKDLRYGNNNQYFFVLAFVFFFTSMLVFLYNQRVDVRPVRDFLIVLTFWKLGTTSNKSTYFAVMRWAALIVLAFALLEILFPNFYASLFNPSSYYFYTRGVEGDAPGIAEEAGLYKTTDGYSGRFSINFLSDHRLSSIFLEPVSFGNFIIVAFIFCIAYWSVLSKPERLLYVSLFLIGTVGSDSRTATFISAIILVYLPLSRRISSLATMYYIPIVFAFSCILSVFLDTSFFVDTLGGRLSWSGFLLLNAHATDLLFGNLNLTGLNIPDAGYFYIITTHTVFGLFMLIAMSSMYPKGIARPDKVLVHGLVLFFAIKMLISSSLFSLKVSPFLWLGIGFVVGGGMNKTLARVRETAEPVMTRLGQFRRGTSVQG